MYFFAVLLYIVAEEAASPDAVEAWIALVLLRLSV
jgi:hypothetical protein